MYKLFDIAIESRINGTQKLYFRKIGDKLSYDTYFNAVSVRKLKRYTSIEKLILSKKVEICTEQCLLKYGDNISLDEIPDNAELLYIKTSSDCDNITVYAEGNLRDIRPVLIICTYHREEQVKANIDYLLKYMSDMELEIILVDNASVIPVENWSSDKVTVLHNINNGGSGGYACGMKYAAEKKRFTHMILMDDDVIFDFIAIQKMLGFLSFLKDEYADMCIAGSMLYAHKPNIQFECGGHFSSDGIQTGYGYGFDLTNRDKLIENESDKLINYGGWWMMCMPMHYAEEGNYPAPYFIKYDDVEYALRCKLNIITLNGVGVWHEDFGSKYNSVYEYFNTRNYLFLMKSQSQRFTPKKAYKTARYLLLEKLCRQQYKMAGAVLIAYEDYLKGEENLAKIDYTQKLADLRKLNYEMLSEDELFERYGVCFDESIYKECGSRRFKRYMQLLLYGHLIPKLFCRKLTITDVLADRKEHYFGADLVVHYDVVQQHGYVTLKSIQLFNKMIIQLKKIKGEEHKK